MVALKLLGGAHLIGADGACAGQACQRHRIALLALLRAAPHRTLSRERLASVLWPEHSDHRARRLLNLSVHVLRRAIGEAAIVSIPPNNELWLRSDLVGSDVASFELACAAGDYRGAVAFYTGPFMDGFFLPNAREFDEWQADQRARLNRVHAAALEALARQAEAQDNLEQAVHWWSELAEKDPLDSVVVVQLMLALEAAGARQSALREGLAHAERLRTELNADPIPELTMLIERIRHQPRPVATRLAERVQFSILKNSTLLDAVSGIATTSLFAS